MRWVYCLVMERINVVREILSFFCSNTCRECFKLPYLGCLNDEENVV